MESSTTERTVSWATADSENVKTWYCTFGDIYSGNTPLVVLHGGPGATHEYLLPLKNLSSQHNIPIIFYDQIGNGRSTHLNDKAGNETFWSVALFITELENILTHLGLHDRGFDLLGHSWGAMLASEFAALRPKGLRRLILANGLASIETWMKGLDTLCAQLPSDVQQVIKETEETGNYKSADYEAAMEVFYRRHLCRLEPWPAKEVVAVMNALTNNSTVYETLYGPSEIVVTGILKNWSVIDKLHRIEVPTLLINGAYDESQDICVQPFFEHIPRVKWMRMDGCSHFCHVEEPDRFLRIIADFLR